jgi:hypothetical protein
MRLGTVGSCLGQHREQTFLTNQTKYMNWQCLVHLLAPGVCFSGDSITDTQCSNSTTGFNTNTWLTQAAAQITSVAELSF